jgi:hypothetical protein
MDQQEIEAATTDRAARIDPDKPIVPLIPDIVFKMKLEIFSCYREALGAENLAAAIAGKKPPNQSLHYELIALQVRDLMIEYCKPRGILPDIPLLADVVKTAEDIKQLREDLKKVMPQKIK